MAVRKTMSVTRFKFGATISDTNWTDGANLSKATFYNSNLPYGTQYLWLEFDLCPDGSQLNINPISVSFSGTKKPSTMASGNISCSFYTGDPATGGTIYKTDTLSIGTAINPLYTFHAETRTLTRYLYVRIGFTSSEFAYTKMAASATADIIVDTPTVTLSAPLNTTKDGDEAVRFEWSVSNTGTNTKTNTLYWKEENESNWQSVSVGSDDYYDLPAGTLPIGNIQWYVTSSNGYATGISSTGSFTLSYDTPSLTITSPEDTEYSGDGSILFAWALAKGADSIDKTEAEYSINGGSYRTFVNRASLVTSYTAAAGFFDQPGTVQWRVRCRHKMAGWGAYATGQFTVTYAAPSVTLTAPTSGSLYGDQAITFSWAITQGSGNVTGTQLEYSTDNGSTWTSLVDYAGKATSKTVSAGTLPAGAVLWRVRAKDQYAGWCEWVSSSFTIIEALPVVSGLSPNGIYRDRTGAIVFSWSETISFGTLNGAELQYDLRDGQGWRSLATVSGSTNQYTAAADTFPAKIAIDWRVRAKNGDNEYGDWKSAYFATIDDTTLATPYYPISGTSCDETAAIVFQWTTSNTLGSEPTGADLQYRYESGDWTTLGSVSGATKQFSAPANTFIGATIYWRVRAYNQDGTAGSWSSAATFSTLDTTPVATALSPNGTVEDTSKAVLFRWSVSNQSGTLPTGSQLQYSHDGTNWTNMGSVTGSATSYYVPGGTITAGSTFWRVRAYNRNGYAGNWSTPLSFIARAAPVVSTVSVTAKPWAAVTWQADDQQSFEIFVDGKSLGAFFGAEKTYQLPDYLKDGDHTIGVRVMGSYSLWSQLYEVTVSVSNTQAQALTLRARTNIDAELSWQGGTGPYYIYRDGEMIGKTNQKAFKDRTALGTHEYQVIEKLVSGDCNASPVLTRTPFVAFPHIAALSGGDWIDLPHRLESQSDPIYSETQEAAYNHLSGMPYPSASIGKNQDATGQYSALFLQNEEDAHRRFRALKGKPVILKTADDEVMIGILHAWERTPKNRDYTAYQFSIQRIGWEDFIDDTA